MFPSIVNLKKGNTKTLISPKVAKQLIEDALNDAANKAEGYFHEVDSTWDHKIDVAKSDIEWGNDAKITVTTDDEIFFYLNGGAKRHWKMFPDFSPKTTASKPATFKSTAGGGTRYPRQYVKDYAYIEPRNWTDTMADLIGDDMASNINKKMGKIVAFKV